VKYLASDLDGTLLQEDHTIRKEDVQAILRFKEEGNKLIISTGRPLEGIKRAFKNYPEIEYDYVVACNGSVVLDKNDNIIYNNYINPETAKLIFKDIVDDKNMFIHFENDGEVYSIESEIKVENEIGIMFSNILPKEVVLKEDGKYTMISAMAIDEDINAAEEMKNNLIEKYGQDVEAFRNQIFVDIAPKNCSKGIALKSLSEKIGINLEDLYVIGDSYNDISMFEITDKSFTFTYAEDGVKKQANNIVNSVAECINKILW